MEVISMRRIHLTGNDAWNPSRYDRPPIVPSVSIIPSVIMRVPTVLPPHDDASDDTSKTGDCDSIDNSVGTTTLTFSPRQLDR